MPGEDVDDVIFGEEDTTLQKDGFGEDRRAVSFGEGGLVLVVERELKDVEVGLSI